MSVIKTFLVTYLLGVLTLAQKIEDEGSKQFIDHPDKNEYLLSQPGTDKHKYGYELKENKHFHHTTTELDGVRLGCYGYVLDGKKYSTQYVADIKGYRPVYTYDAINVYPKSGGTREASFVRNFEEDTDRSGNLRYFFPEGCRGFDSLISPQENIKIPNLIPTFTNQAGGGSPDVNTFTPSRSPTRNPVTPAKIVPSQPPRIPQTPRIPPATQPPKIIPPQTPNKPRFPPKVPEKYLPPVQNAIPEPLPVNGRYVTKALPPRPTTPTKTSLSVNKSPLKSNTCDLGNCESQAITITKSVPDNECVGCCVDEETLPKIVIPIKLKNGGGRSGSCSSYAKLILPADNVDVNNLKTNPTELARMVLQSIA